MPRRSRRSGGTAFLAVGQESAVKMVYSFSFLPALGCLCRDSVPCFLLSGRLARMTIPVLFNRMAGSPCGRCDSSRA